MKQDKQTPSTLLQVAKCAGVSRSTASLTLRGGPHVSEKTRKKVLEAVRQLNYVYDRGAANLRSKSSSTVGLVFPDIDNPFYSAFLAGINQELNKFNKIVILGTTFESLIIQDRLISTMLEYRVSGIILFHVPGTSNDLFARIEHLGIPVVLVNRKFHELSCDFIGLDDVMAGQMATEHLIQNGHRRIAFIGGFSELSAWQDRKQGYEKALRKAGLDIDDSLVTEGPITRESGYELMGKILDLKDVPTAAFCFNDIVSIGAMMKLKEKGLIPGYDMSIVGVDDIPEASIFSPKLTTVSSFPYLRGSKAAILLNARMEDHSLEAKSIIIQPKLIIRESCSYKVTNLPQPTIK